MSSKVSHRFGIEAKRTTHESRRAPNDRSAPLTSGRARSRGTRSAHLPNRSLRALAMAADSRTTRAFTTGSVPWREDPTGKIRPTLALSCSRRGARALTRKTRSRHGGVADGPVRLVLRGARTARLNSLLAGDSREGLVDVRRRGIARLRPRGGPATSPRAAGEELAGESPSLVAYPKSAPRGNRSHPT